MKTRNPMPHLRKLAEVAAGLVLAVLFGTFLIQIVFRYLLDLPLGWTVEFVSICWVWTVLFGYAFVVSERDVIRLDIVYSLLPRSAQRGLDIAVNLICAGVFLWTLPQVWGYISFMAIEKTSYMRLPLDWVFSIYIPFSLAVILRSLINAWQALRYGPSHPSLPTDAARAHDYD